MATLPPYLDQNNSNPFTQASSRLPDDTVFYSIYPDDSLSQNALQSLHLQILNSVSSFTSSYIWQHEPFTLTVSFQPIPHLRGQLRFGDNLDDEWFTVFLLFQISLTFPSLSIHVHDTDGEFLLIEAAYHLPRWLNPENSQNRCFIRRGIFHIIPRSSLPIPTLTKSLNFLIGNEGITVAPDSVQSVIQNRIAGYPEKAKSNTHTVRVRVPVPVAQVLKHAPPLISLAVEGFYDRDVDMMKHAAKMQRFLKGPTGEVEMVTVAVKMSRAMYAQLMQQKFQAPKCYPMPSKADMEAELGLKIASGFEMMYQEKKKQGEEGKGSDWKQYIENLDKSGYFKGLLPGSEEYKRLMENAEEYYRKSSSFSKTSEILNAPVRQIDEILSLPYSAEDFKNQDIPPSDDDSWIYSGEDELNSALQDRQKEMELYELKNKKKKSKEEQDTGPSSSSKKKKSKEQQAERFDLTDIVKSMQGFIHKISSYAGAEVPEGRDPREVELDVDRFIKELESAVTGEPMDDDEGSSDMDFDECEDGGDACDQNEDEEDHFMDSYSDAMNDELKDTTLKKSFIHANEPSGLKDEGTSNAKEEVDEDFSPVDVDVNLVKNLLDSYSSQQGLPGPASNMLGLMGLQLPKDDKNKRDN
ncbi:SGT1 protein [Corchorus capsularis]|uniref:SGT1 protein n=1 Tax=Corchorus capsularis TaxID=210143 RepID=A0A1R3GE11_COCAP|nr:SGT1 protein [Corchorus capsularis]